MHPGSFLGETTEETPWVDPGQTKDIVSWLFLGMPWYLQSQWPWKGSTGHIRQAFLQPNFNVIP